MNNTPVLFTLTCTRLCVTLVLLPSIKPKVQCNPVLFLFIHDYMIKDIL
jgi:hypothetical protein